MANSLSTALYPDIWRPMVQDFLENTLVVKPISNMKFETELVAGDTLNFPYLSDVRVQAYTAGTDLTIDDVTATQSAMTIDQSRAATFYVDPTETRQAADKSWGAKMARRSAYVLAQEMDQNVLKEGTDNAATTIAGGSVSASNILSKFGSAMQSLEENEATDGEMFVVISPYIKNFLFQAEVANGFNKADTALVNGFVGPSSTGFKVYISNNLETSVTLTMDTQPTAGDTTTVYGVTWTWIADGGTATAGQLKVGANVADAQAIFVTAINGTTAPSAGDYLDVATVSRRKYQNRQLACSAFSGNVATLTGFGRINASETFTAGTNVFGTESSSILFGRVGSLSIGMQMYPQLYVRPEPKKLGDNYITHTLYGKKVFYFDTLRLVNMTYNQA